MRLPANTIVITKGDDPAHPGYSAFEGHTRSGRNLLDDLRERNVARLYVGGIATDYCVKATALDAIHAGLDVRILRDAITGIDVHPGDVERALDDMSGAGTTLVDRIEAT